MICTSNMLPRSAIHQDNSSTTNCRFMLLILDLLLQSDSLPACSYVLLAFRLLLVALLAQSWHGLSSRVCLSAHFLTLPYYASIPIEQFAADDLDVWPNQPCAVSRIRRGFGISVICELLVLDCLSRRLLMSSWY